jgi:hypothetical protein
MALCLCKVLLFSIGFSYSQSLLSWTRLKHFATQSIIPKKNHTRLWLSSVFPLSSQPSASAHCLETPLRLPSQYVADVEPKALCNSKLKQIAYSPAKFIKYFSALVYEHAKTGMLTYINRLVVSK